MALKHAFRFDVGRLVFWARQWTVLLLGGLVLAMKPVQAQAPGQPSPTDAGSGIPFQVVSDREAVLSSQMMARVELINIKLGDRVTKDQVLVVFDCKELEAKRAGAVAELVAASDTHQSKLRLQGLGAAGELEVALAASAVDRAGANVSQIDASMINCKLLAPFAGEISSVRVKQQEVVAPNQAVLDIVDTQNLKLHMYLPATLSRKVAVGTSIAARINGDDQVRTASVTRINPRIDGASQTLEVEAVFIKQFPGLKPGSLGNGQILVTEAKPQKKNKPPKLP